jgi:hypothetical protein
MPILIQYIQIFLTEVVPLQAADVKHKTEKLPLLAVFLQPSWYVVAQNKNNATISVFIGSNFLWLNGDWLGGIIGVGLLNLGRARISEGLFVCRSPDGRSKNI